TNGTGLQLNGTNVHAINGNININGTVNKLSHYDVGQAGVHLNNVILNASSGSVNINGSVNSTVGDAYADTFKGGVIFGAGCEHFGFRFIYKRHYIRNIWIWGWLGAQGFSNTEINISGNASINGFSYGDEKYEPCASWGVAFGFGGQY
ncbi:hypothetical protein O5175_27385, partial [Escherichia coli]|nr:hypothetical protein [Escherichia coli]